jgi:hypothetical protein
VSATAPEYDREQKLLEKVTVHCDGCVASIRHDGGSTKEIELVGRTETALLIWWPPAGGYYEINAKTGQLRGGKRLKCWRMDAAELARCLDVMSNPRPKRLTMSSPPPQDER